MKEMNLVVSSGVFSASTVYEVAMMEAVAESRGIPCRFHRYTGNLDAIPSDLDVIVLKDMTFCNIFMKYIKEVLPIFKNTNYFEILSSGPYSPVFQFIQNFAMPVDAHYLKPYGFKECDEIYAMNSKESIMLGDIENLKQEIKFGEAVGMAKGILDSKFDKLNSDLKTYENSSHVQSIFNMFK